MMTTVRHFHHILSDYPSDAVLSYLSSVKGGKASGRQMTVGELRALTDFDDLNAWVCLNPMRPVGGGGRGGEADVCEVRALFCDLDIGEGKMPDEGTCRDTIEILSQILGQPPSHVTFTGHEFQPVWRVRPDRYVERWRQVKARWAMLVRTVARSVGGGSVDGAFDLSRVLRIPGSTNWKFPDAPVQTRIEWVDGEPLSRSEVEQALDAYGFVDGEQVGKPHPRSTASSITCRYVRAMIDGVVE